MSRLGSEGEDIIGRWSEEKLELLAKYLKAYSVMALLHKSAESLVEYGFLNKTSNCETLAT